MKKPASFQIATTHTQASAVSGEPSQLRSPAPASESALSSSPYWGVKKKSQMLATAIMGRIVGVKNATRSHVRPRIAESTQSAIASANAIDTGTVAMAYSTLLRSDRQN